MGFLGNPSEKHLAWDFAVLFKVKSKRGLLLLDPFSRPY